MDQTFAFLIPTIMVLLVYSMLFYSIHYMSFKSSLKIPAESPDEEEEFDCL